jgi:hypothetical protein
MRPTSSVESPRFSCVRVVWKGLAWRRVQRVLGRERSLECNSTDSPGKDHFTLHLPFLHVIIHILVYCSDLITLIQPKNSFTMKNNNSIVLSPELIFLGATTQLRISPHFQFIKSLRSKHSVKRNIFLATLPDARMILPCSSSGGQIVPTGLPSLASYWSILYLPASTTYINFVIRSVSRANGRNKQKKSQYRAWAIKYHY